MENFFKLKEKGTDVKTEIMAGITTFLTMAYILAVNPGILSQAGLAGEKVFAATILGAVIATLVMSLYANLPFALAPGMGLNAFLTYTVCMGMHKTPQFALTAVFVEGLIFIALTACNVREAIVNAIPANLKKAIGAGIGMFVAFIGLQNAGIIAGGATLVQLSDNWFKGPAEPCCSASSSPPSSESRSASPNTPEAPMFLPRPTSSRLISPLSPPTRSISSSSCSPSCSWICSIRSER